MDPTSRCRPILAVACCLIALQSSYSQTPTSSKRSPATVSGRVTIKGKAAAGVAIGLRRMESNRMLEMAGRAVTDQEGNYRITNVAEGSYDVNVVAPGYVLADQQSRKMILVNDGENIDGLNFALTRGGVITGKVTDADGRAVIQQQVNAYRADAWERAAARESQPVFPVHGVSTDDRGIYRMFGLVAGRYKVAVGRADDGLPNPQPPGRASYNRVFHPDITEPAKAAIIEVSEGSEATNIDIALERPLETFSVSGRIVDGEKGLPVPGVRLGLERINTERIQNFTNSSTTNVEGEFTFDNVPPGRYHASLISERGSELFMDRMPFEITDRDVTGMVLKLTQGASVSGIVAIESDDPKALIKLRETELRVYVSPHPSGFGGRSATSSIGADGSFRAAGLPAGVLSVYLAGGPNQPGPVKGFNVLRIERDGITQPPNNFGIQRGEQVTGVRIVVSYGNGVIRGRIEADNGKFPADVRFSVRVSRTGDRDTNPGAFTQADARGHFILEGLPSGVYDLFIMGASLERRIGRQVKQQVSVTSGSTTEVTVTFDTSETKPPQP